MMQQFWVIFRKSFFLVVFIHRPFWWFCCFLLFLVVLNHLLGGIVAFCWALTVCFFGAKPAFSAAGIGQCCGDIGKTPRFKPTENHHVGYGFTMVLPL